MGLAASAASVIAMAGDTILMGPASFLMIHNCWVVAIGDRNDMAETAAFLEPFDDAMAERLRGSGAAMDKAAVVKPCSMQGDMAVRLASHREGVRQTALLNPDDMQEDEAASDGSPAT